ncbi:MAG: hypothetical protein JWP89_1771 [Schlesneria sp.]|nr:hypothetical protein [Schlesneria sp.]
MLMNDNPDDWKCIFQNGIDSTTIGSVQKAHELGLHPYDVAIFEAIHHDYGQVEERSSLAERALGPDKRTVAEGAVDRCFKLGWIQVITTDFENEMRDELRQGGYVLVTGLIGTELFREVIGKSVAGIISFTRIGADLWNRWCGESTYGHYAIGYDEDQSRAVFGESSDVAKDAALVIWQNSSWSHPLTREAITTSGPWCDRWWKRYQAGFKIRYSCVMCYEEDYARESS